MTTFSKPLLGFVALICMSSCVFFFFSSPSSSTSLSSSSIREITATSSPSSTDQPSSTSVTTPSSSQPLLPPSSSSSISRPTQKCEKEPKKVIPRPVIVSRASSEKTSSLCFYRVQNGICVGNEDGLLYLNENHQEPITIKNGTGSESMRKFRLCNELRKKFHLGWKPLPTRDDDNNSENNRLLLVTTIPHRRLHVVTCWQFYGYHLFQCSVAAFYAEYYYRDYSFGNSNNNNNNNSSNNNDDETDDFDLYLFNHAKSMPKLSREHYSHKMFLGSSESWLEKKRKRTVIKTSNVVVSNSDSSMKSSPSSSSSKKDDVLDAPMWGLWAANALQPNQVFELEKPQTRQNKNNHNYNNKKNSFSCYKQGIIGQPVHHLVPDIVRKEHVKKLKKIFLPARKTKEEEPSSSTKKIKVLISQRGSGSKQGSRKIANLNVIIKELFEDDQKIQENFEVEAVDFADNKRFDEQMKLAHQSDILISTHGAGNIWLAFLEGGGKTIHAKDKNNNNGKQSSSSSSSLSSSPLFIELWPQDSVARDVYRTMCKQYGVRYEPIFARMKPLFSKPEEVKFSFLHQDVEVPLEELKRVLLAELSE